MPPKGRLRPAAIGGLVKPRLKRGCETAKATMRPMGSRESEFSDSRLRLVAAIGLVTGLARPEDVEALHLDELDLLPPYGRTAAEISRYTAS
jgi:hypothetical protein